MFRKAWRQYLIAILAISLAVALSVGIYMSNKISLATSESYLFESKNEAIYHVMIIVDGSNQAYGTAFMEGINKTSEQYKVAVEVIRVEGNDYENEVMNLLDMAIYAKVDGVILHGFASESLSKKVEKVIQKDIPVIVLNEDLPYSNRISYIGVNRYKIGQVAGKELAKAMEGSGKVVVIEQKSYKKDDNLSEDLMLLGLTDTLKEYQELNLELVRYTEQGVLSAETIATQIFRETSNINGIFCTNSQNTLGIAQALIDNNLVNEFVLVGYGDEEELLGYIEKGKIARATIVINYEDIGRAAIKTFYEYKNNRFVSGYVNISLQVIDENNVQDYLIEMSENYDKDE